MTEGERDRCGSCQRQRIKSVIASPTAVGRGNPRVLLRASPELKEDVSSFQRFTAARVLKEDFIFFSTSSPCSLEIASSPWLLAKTTKIERGDPVTLLR